MLILARCESSGSIKRFAPQTFSSLRHRNYRLYFGGQLVSQLGQWLQNAAQAWLILSLTHSAEAVGVMGFFLYGPYALFGLFGGALADRFDYRKTLIVSQILMALTAAALAVVTYAHLNAVWVIDLLAAIRGLILVINNPSRQALMVQLVGRSELSNAIALNSSLSNATRIIGPGIAGLLIASFGLTICFALNAVSFIPVIAALIALRTSEFHVEQQMEHKMSIWNSMREGLVYAKRRKTVAVSLSMFFVVSFLAINFNVLIPVLAQQTIHGGPEVYGFISSIFGFGAFVGAIITASRSRTSQNLVLIAAAGFGVTNLILATQSSLFGVAALLFATGIFYTMYTASTNALVQLASPAFMQGRISGLYNYVFIAPGPFGSLLVGWLCDRGGTGLALIVAGVATVIMVGVGIAMRPWPMPAGTVTSRR